MDTRTVIVERINQIADRLADAAGDVRQLGLAVRMLCVGLPDLTEPARRLADNCSERVIVYTALGDIVRKIERSGPVPELRRKVMGD